MLPESKSRGPLTERIAGWSVRHRMVTIVGWFTLVIVSVLASTVLGLGSTNSTDPGESGRADRVLDAQIGYVPLQENVLVQPLKDGPLLAADPEVRGAIGDLTTSMRRAPGAVAALRSPLEPGGADLVSEDGRSGLVNIQIAGPGERFRDHYAAIESVVEEVSARHPGVRLAQAGDVSLSDAVNDGIKDDMKRAEFFSLPLTVVILLVVFGSLIAAGIPLLLAATTVLAAFGLLQVAAHWVPVNSATSSVVLLIGLAVGIDYSLFYLRREREERAAGHGVTEALEITARTSGHVVVVSGLTVMLCLTGLLFTGLDNFRGLTVGTILVVGLAMIGSVTVLPALLALLGHHVDKARIPWLGRRRTAAGESRFWTAVARAVVRRPLLWGGLATITLVVLTLPAFGMRLQDAAVTDSLPREVPAVDSAIRMQEAFPGSPLPAWVVIWEKRAAALDAPGVRQAVKALHPVSTARVDRIMVARVPLADSGTGEVANRSLEELRAVKAPAALGSLDGLDYAVAGKTAFAYDFTKQITERSPLVIGFVLTLALILLAISFRSLAVSLVSILLNLLSLGAAYGVLTWVFQDSRLGTVLGFTSYGGVIGWLPLFMFVILFGLSMDYHIFVLSRIRERRAAGAPVRQAVVAGIGTSSGVVTSAAVIMTAAFSVFVVLSAIEYKMMGIGLSVAILIDATLVRGVLLPAAITLLGERFMTPTTGRGGTDAATG
ncbi:RND superfamily putative drug exporter [Streptosporangium album]|uniref:RND superfamily putative drug exporter n=1 Tax=Streptosporangium album TaxID=47479 RepID=A0A7W7W832_9ACTN|nr:MMPL family transporter [Streptosporangium album]MBB4937528.1 RND superfamily putative drug exporter [Streptosporangium album]